MKNENKKSYEVTLTVDFTYVTTIEAGSEAEARDLAAKELFETPIDRLDVDDVQTEVEVELIEE